MLGAGPGGWARRACLLGQALACALAWAAAWEQAAWASDDPPAEERPAEERAASGLVPKLAFGLEGRVNFRRSDENRFPVKFPFQPRQLPPGQKQAFEETVDSGSHFEVSKLILTVDAAWSEWIVAHG